MSDFFRGSFLGISDHELDHLSLVPLHTLIPPLAHQAMLVFGEKAPLIRGQIAKLGASSLALKVELQMMLSLAETYIKVWRRTCHLPREEQTAILTLVVFVFCETHKRDSI